MRSKVGERALGLPLIVILLRIIRAWSERLARHPLPWNVGLQLQQGRVYSMFVDHKLHLVGRVWIDPGWEASPDYV